MKSDFLANAVVKFDLAGRNTLNSFYMTEIQTLVPAIWETK